MHTSGLSEEGSSMTDPAAQLCLTDHSRLYSCLHLAVVHRCQFQVPRIEFFVRLQ